MFTIPTAPAPPVHHRDQPVTHHGGEHVYPGRRVVEGDWLYPSPELCRDDRPDGQWIANGQVLVCRFCGLDCT
ncbi:hypothetical protein [Micromonospora sp. NPDC049107]|uniref:hypothetical protein n=1 Tax=unclassified Micromonospora TaxID=2617518 RepID=UPI0033E97F00